MAKDNLLYDIDGVRQPYSTEAEQAVLGSMIVDPSCINDVTIALKPDNFYIPQHRQIYQAISSMFELNQAIDPVSLLEKLKSDNIYDETGGKAYLMQLVENVPTTANIQTYINIVKERYLSRSLLEAARNIITNVNENTMDASRLIDDAEQRIFEIRQGREVNGLTHIAEIITNETYDRLTKMNDPETHDDFVGIPSGLSELDRKLSGLNKSNIIILGARPAMGKTSLALNIARNVAVQAGRTVCFFSLEMSRDELAQRLLSSESGIPSEKLRSGELEAEEWTRLTLAGETLSKSNLYIDETASITIPEMKAKLRRMKRVDLVLIDYLGLLHSARPIESRVQEISDITRNLKIMAKELKVPIIVCAQLNRGTEGAGKSHRPALSDLRDSGSIEQDADIVLFLYREGYYGADKSEDDEDKPDPTSAEIIIAKNRHGETGTVKLHWDGQFTRFTSIDNFHE